MLGRWIRSASQPALLRASDTPVPACCPTPAARSTASGLASATLPSAAGGESNRSACTGFPTTFEAAAPRFGIAAAGLVTVVERLVAVLAGGAPVVPGLVAILAGLAAVVAWVLAMVPGLGPGWFVGGWRARPSSVIHCTSSGL